MIDRDKKDRGIVGGSSFVPPPPPHTIHGGLSSFKCRFIGNFPCLMSLNMIFEIITDNFIKN